MSGLSALSAYQAGNEFSSLAQVCGLVENYSNWVLLSVTPVVSDCGSSCTCLRKSWEWVQCGFKTQLVGTGSPWGGIGPSLTLRDSVAVEETKTPFFFLFPDFFVAWKRKISQFNTF
jgi:hypothetical protein